MKRSLVMKYLCEVDHMHVAKSRSTLDVAQRTKMDDISANIIEKVLVVRNNE